MAITHSDSQAIRTVIERQIAAFLQDNASLAFSQAAPGIQIQFGKFVGSTSSDINIYEGAGLGRTLLTSIIGIVASRDQLITIPIRAGINLS